MRTADRPLPTITLDPGALADWPVRPVIAIEAISAPPYVWDGGQLWDTVGQVWDGVSGSAAWVDATCDFTGCEITFDRPDESNNFPAGQCVIQLDNRSGRWASYNADGSPTDYGVGQQIWIWADEQAGPGAWWMFAGRVARWDEQSGDVIEIEAFDYLSDLAQPGGTMTPGADADLPAQRLTAITALAAGLTARTRFATGTVRLTRQATERAPLEEMQVVAGSDGGILYGDSDGTIVYADRLWRNGRLDQTAVPVVATNVCTAPIVLWDPVLSTTDNALASTVTLENVAGLKATASHPGLPYVLAIDTADLYLLEPGLWPAVDWRRGDRIRLLHDSRTPTGTARIDVETVLITLAHSFTPDGWVMTIGTTRALAYYTRTTWDSGAVWDDGVNVWGY